MVSNRCKMIVKDELKKLGLHYVHLNLGEVDVMEKITNEQREELKRVLLKSGLELMDDKRAMLIERIKNVIIEMVHYTEELPKVNFSNYLSEKLKYDYTYLANLFSETEGTTIEHFIILHKIERIKEYEENLKNGCTAYSTLQRKMFLFDCHRSIQGLAHEGYHSDLYFQKLLLPS